MDKIKLYLDTNTILDFFINEATRIKGKSDIKVPEKTKFMADNIGRIEFVKKMNEKAQSFGLAQTYFYNENGLDTEDTLPGAVGSAKDMAMLMEYILKNHPEIVESTKHGSFKIESLNNISHYAKNTNVDIDKIPGVIASKTGYTNLAGGNLVIAMDPFLGRPIIISVFGSTYDGRFDDISKIVDATMKYIEQ